MGDFDYSKDIAPLRGNFFSDPSMNDRERTQLRKRFSQEIVPLMEVHDRQDAAERDKRRDDLSYQKGMFELRQVRKNTREERDALTKIPEITAALDSAFNDPTATTITKAKAIADASTRYAPYITRNPALSQAISGYSGRLAVEDADKAKRDATRTTKKTTSKQRAFDRANRLAAAFVDPATIRNALDEGGLSEEEAQDFMDDLAISKSSQEAHEVGQREAAAQKGRQEAAGKHTESQFEEFNTFLNGLKADDEGDELGDGYDTAGGEPRPFTLKAEDRRRLKAALQGLHKVDPKDMPITDEELFDFALERKYAHGTGAPPRSSGFTDLSE